MTCIHFEKKHIKFRSTCTASGLTILWRWFFNSLDISQNVLVFCVMTIKWFYCFELGKLPPERLVFIIGPHKLGLWFLIINLSRKHAFYELIFKYWRADMRLKVKHTLNCTMKFAYTKDYSLNIIEKYSRLKITSYTNEY